LSIKKREIYLVKRLSRVPLCDEQLASHHFFHDKRLLYHFLGQDYIELPLGDYCLKPSISTEGLGIGVKNLTIPHTYVIQPSCMVNISMLTTTTVSFGLLLGL